MGVQEVITTRRNLETY